MLSEGKSPLVSLPEVSIDQVGEDPADSSSSSSWIVFTVPEEASIAPLMRAYSASFVYDGNGLRQSETTGAGTTEFAWDLEGSLPLLLSDGTNSYIYGPDDTPIEQISSSGTPTYLLDDQLGSTRALTNSSGSVTATFSYDPWGNLTGSTGSATTPFMFAGAYLDSSTGLYYLQARYYDPTTGQFLSVDPDVAETDQPFAYADDDPVNEADPTGDCYQIGWVCVGSGPENESLSIGFHPHAAWQAIINLGDGLVGNGPSGTQCNGFENVPYYIGGSLWLFAGEFGDEPDDDENSPNEDENQAQQPRTPPTAAVPAPGGQPSGLGDLTAGEVAEIQAVVDEAGRPLEVVGSAAEGTRRSPGSGLPLGKGPGTQSDIDYLVPYGSLPYYADLGDKLPNIDQIIPGTHNPFIGPAIRFKPGTSPVAIPGAT